MKYHFITTTLLLLLYTQSYAQGLIFEKDSFMQWEKIETTRGVSYTKYSLEKYTPIPYPQTGSTCLAQAFTNARSTLVAMELNKTDVKSKNQLLFSPYHFYYENNSNKDGDCSNSLSIHKAAKYALNQGFCPITKVEYTDYYPFTTLKLCSKSDYPRDFDANKKAALKFKLDKIYTVQSILDIQTAISKNMPIVLAMSVPKSFEICGEKVWSPKATDKLKESYGHAVLCVGYDNDYMGGAIRIMNSWGENWADKGFVWIKYKDLGNWTYGGYALQKVYGSRGIDNEDILNETLQNYFSQDSSAITANIVQNLIKSDSITIEESFDIGPALNEDSDKYYSETFGSIYGILKEE